MTERAVGPPATRDDPGQAPSRSRTLMGVEEEYILVDPRTREATPRSAGVVKRAAADLGDQVSPELTQVQVEAKTSPCTDLGELYRQLRRMRAVIAAAAEAERVRVIASGTAVLGNMTSLAVVEKPHYLAQDEMFRALVHQQAIAASQVHVSIPDRERGLLAGNHLRPWLPVLIALMANSPYWAGRDTGYASWRRLVWERWPAFGPPPYFTCADDFDRMVTALATGGAVVDRESLFWDLRPSARFPTLEVRAADVPITAEESALLAGLVRALVVTALWAVERGDPGPRVPEQLLRVACWRAARDGLSGAWADCRTGDLMGADEAVDSLIRHIRPALEEFGDLAAVTSGLRRLQAMGPGAERQRAAYARDGRAASVVDYLAEQMTDGDLG